MKRKFNAKKIFGILLLVIASILLFGYIVMWLWNGILPSVIHVSTITFYQALGILLLSKILFGGFRGRGGCHKDKSFWKAEMESKFANMSSEEKEQFKKDWKNRCRTWGRQTGSNDNAIINTPE